MAGGGRLAAVALLAVVAACGTAAPRQTATGIVVAVEGPNVAEVSSFTLRTADGLQLGFSVDSLSLVGGGKPAPHLREHMTSGQAIVVEFYRDDCCDRLVATRYTDAP